MIKPKFYFPVDASTQCPKSGALNISYSSFDVYVGNFSDIKTQLLGQEGVSALTYGDEKQVLHHFSRYFGQRPVSFYYADTQTIRVLQQRDNNVPVVLRDYSVHENTKDDDTSITSPPIFKPASIFGQRNISRLPSLKAENESEFPVAPQSSFFAQRHGLFQHRSAKAFLSTDTDSYQTNRTVKTGEQRRAR